MSTTDDFSSGRADGHVTEELPAFIGGELDLDAAREVTGHLRDCPACRAELVEVAAGIGLMRRLDGMSDAEREAPSAPHAATTSARRSWTRSPFVAAAAVLLLLVGVVSAALLFTGGGSNRPDARVVLAPVAKSSARGSVAMRSSGEVQAMDVDTSLGAAPSDRYYEVWLLDRTSGKMLPVGVLPPDGRGRYRLPSEILKSYDSVDISLQPDDGSTRHSADSVLRANYA